MAQLYTPPTGRLSTKRRTFEEVVRDIRPTVYSVVRIRQIDPQNARCDALGSGFFVSHDIFLTCNHVMNPVTNPHVDGDIYRLVAQTASTGGVFHQISNVTLGQNLYLYPSSDLALLRCPNIPTQPFVALEYGAVPIGKSIGVAGYPIPQLGVANGQLQFDGLIFRVAQGVVNSTYTRTINMDQGIAMPNLAILEVNFLFVPGNSGGPIFDAQTGRVTAFVHGYMAMKIREKVEQVTLVNPLPQGISNQYIENLNAIYSLGIQMTQVRTHLEALGVTL